MNLVEFLRETKLEDLEIPEPILINVKSLGYDTFQKVYAAIQAVRALDLPTLKGLTPEEYQTLTRCITNRMVALGLVKPKPQPARETRQAVTQNRPIPTPRTSKPVEHKTSHLVEKGPSQAVPKQPANHQVETVQPSHSVARNPESPSPLAEWENRLVPLLRKVELIGEIPVTKEELDEISLHLARLFYNRSEQTVLDVIEQRLPATFLVFMVGQGIQGYNMGDFWPAYEQALHRQIGRSAFGQLFEKLLQRFGKPQFKDLQEKSLRYVSLILAHGGIPVYCLKDFFNNIVLNCVLRPQLSALDGEELVEEVLKHTSYTVNTDKPVLYFLEYGGSTAANLLDRSRNLLTAWQQQHILLSSDEAGLPAHLTQYFAEWTRENSAIALERGPRNRLKRPLLSIDPWGLGVFLFLPSQPVPALNTNDLSWKIEAGDYHEEIKVRTQRKGEQIETREVTIRLGKVPESILVQFSQGDNQYEWKIKGYSEDHLVLAFDPASGHVQTHILARETWLLYPCHFTIAIKDGAGNLLEVLPELPGEWSKFKLECWDLSLSTSLVLFQHEQVFREIFVRSQEKIEKPYLDGGKLVPSDLEDSAIPIYTGAPPLLYVPITKSGDIQTELSRWQIFIESHGPADPEVSTQTVLAKISKKTLTIRDSTAAIGLEAPEFLGKRPTGTYQVSIKGPLGRDATLLLRILPECKVTGLKDLYIPEPRLGPQKTIFSLETSLLDGVDCLNGADEIEVENTKPGLYMITAPSEISSVGLLIRRESINHQFIRIPIYFRIKRLRWRLVGDNGLAENWLQTHLTRSVKDLLQEESPLLIVDLPGNDDGKIKLQLKLIDIQGNTLQQLNPADRSSKRANRFWRFDLSQIKNTLDMNDSPVFRVDLVGIQDKKVRNAFNLPVLVFTRQIMIDHLRGEGQTSSEHYDLKVTWQERKPLHSRTLVLWSLFRPWQAPIIENIPNTALGMHDFRITKRNHAGGIYRMQMVVIDPWASTPPPALPPASGSPGCVDVEFSPPQDRAKKLEREVFSATYRQSTQFSNRIELSLIRHYLGEVEASYHDLDVCCHNLLPASSREILVLRSILETMDSPKLNKEFGNQIILPDIINRLYKDLITGEINISEFTSILNLAPNSKVWSAEACEILVQLEDPKVRSRALVQLVAKDVERAVVWIMKLLQQSNLSIEDAVELLYEEKPNAIEILKKMSENATAEQLLSLLAQYNPYSGLPLVKIGSWVLTNAGWGRIEEILDPRTRVSVDSFLEGDGNYLLSVSLHIHESYDLTGEKVLVNMRTNEIIFLRANLIYECEDCEDFVTAKRDLFKSHLIAAHGHMNMYPGERNNTVPLTSIQFNMNPRQQKRDL